MTRLRSERESEFFLWVSDVTPSYLSKSFTIRRQSEEEHYQPL